MFSVWETEISKMSIAQMRMGSIPHADIHFNLIVSRIIQILLAYLKLYQQRWCAHIMMPFPNSLQMCTYDLNTP